MRYTHKVDRENMATCSVVADARLAVINLSRSWAEKVTPALVRETAMHEIAHLVTGDLLCAAAKRYLSEDEADKAAELAANRICFIVKKMEAGWPNGQGSPTSSS